MFKEHLKFNNIITLILRDKDNNIIDQRIHKNLVTNVGFELILDLLGCHGETGITYGAVGTGTTAAAITDTTLEAELNRNSIVYLRSETIGTISVFFPASEANGTIAEIGFFGNDATPSVDTGTLFNRIVLNTPLIKTTDYTLTIDLDLYIS